MSLGEIVEHKLPVALSEHEVYSYGLEQAKLLNQVSELEEKRKEINGEIKPRKDRISYLSPVIEEGKEIRNVECVWEPHGNKQKVLVRQDNLDVVDGPLDMTEAELQKSMFE